MHASMFRLYFGAVLVIQHPLHIIIGGFWFFLVNSSLFYRYFVVIILGNKHSTPKNSVHNLWSLFAIAGARRCAKIRPDSARFLERNASFTSTLPETLIKRFKVAKVSSEIGDTAWSLPTPSLHFHTNFHSWE